MKGMRELTNFDLFCAVNEIKYLEGARIRKVYQIEDKGLRITFRTVAGTVDLIIILPYTMHIATKVKETKTPTAFAMALRKHLAGKILHGIEQPNMDRIILFKFQDVSLIVEFFTKNFILVDQDYNIITLLRSYKRGSRTIERGAKYTLPEMKKPQLHALPPVLPPKKAEESVLEYLLRNFNISSYYAMHVSKELEQIPEEEWRAKLSEIFESLRTPSFAIFKDGSYGVILTTKMYNEIDRNFTTFSQLLETLYVREVEAKERAEALKELRKMEEKLQRKLSKQLEHYELLLAESKKAYTIGEKLKVESVEFERLLNALSEIQKRHRTQTEIVSELKKIDARVKGVEKGKIILEIE